MTFLRFLTSYNTHHFHCVNILHYVQCNAMHKFIINIDSRNSMTLYFADLTFPFIKFTNEMCTSKQQSEVAKEGEPI